MKLVTAERIAGDNVSEEELISAFEDDTGRGDFIILSQSEQVYMQASGEGDDPYVMEYREGDNDHHFRCAQELSKEQVRTAFMKYFKNDGSWKTDFEWRQLENKPWWRFW